MLIGKIIIYSLYYLKYNNIEQRPNLNEEIIIKTKIKNLSLVNKLYYKDSTCIKSMVKYNLEKVERKQEQQKNNTQINEL